MIKKYISCTGMFIFTAFIVSASIQASQSNADIKSHAEKSDNKLYMMIGSAISTYNAQLTREIVQTYQEDFQDLSTGQISDLIDFSRSPMINNPYYQTHNNNLKQIRVLLNTHATRVTYYTQKETDSALKTQEAVIINAAWEQKLIEAQKTIDCSKKRADLALLIEKAKELEISLSTALKRQALDQLIVLREQYKVLYNKIQKIYKPIATLVLDQYQMLVAKCCLLEGKVKK